MLSFLELITTDANEYARPLVIPLVLVPMERKTTSSTVRE
jgi:hypothetical protein